MRVFFLDLWMDLRDKRLAPIAILLLAAIVAVPIILAKGSSPSTPTVTAPTGTAAAATPVISAPQQSTQTASKLQTFSPRDPFEPTKTVAPAGTSTGSGTATSGGGSGSGSGSSSGSGSGSGSNPTTPTTTGTGGGQPTSNGPSTTPPSGTGNTTTPTKTTLFTYTVDMRFGTSDNTKTYKGVKRLELIPSDKNPKAVFLGVTTTGKTAVFLIDSNISVATPGGKCRPSPDQCTFLYLRPDANHDLATLTDSDGTVYHLRLTAIHRVIVSSSTGSGNSGSGQSNGTSTGTTRSPAFTGRAGSDPSSNGAAPAAGQTPPGEPDHRSSFQQFFADSGQ